MPACSASMQGVSDLLGCNSALPKCHFYPSSSGTSGIFLKHLATVQGKSMYALDRIASQPEEVPASRMKSIASTKMYKIRCITDAQADFVEREMLER